MRNISGRLFFSHLLRGLCGCIVLLFPGAAFSQQTLGGITGTVTDASGAAMADTQGISFADASYITRSQTRNNSGSYDFSSLPIGTYTLTFTHYRFETLYVPSIVADDYRTAFSVANLKFI